MTRAVVIRTVGDPEIAGAIVDGMSRQVIPLNDSELSAVKAECARLRQQRDIRACGDEKRFQAACKALEAKYYTRPHGRLYKAILKVWACMWFSLYMLSEYMTGDGRR